ncbi:hypothetical protein [Pedobacter rhizosphaerae]|uniref:Membrane domain of glycerophosphoryl diester phosphodiesterase n=1 Tax=Pedobacter rhizosphaerae TaxID=390241 RepID=A0A1H9LND4_9SPHI|nr:hypothetical protein [Pedobacter rhizosphaerae]SER12920.1 hypothetical protein SAMN04488023_104223 [Pedobacter rhizosphaerae]
MAQQVEFKKVRDFGEVIGDTFLFIKQNFNPLLKTFIYFCGFFMLAGLLTAIMVQLNMFRETGGMKIAPIYTSSYARISDFVGQYLLLIIFVMLFYNAIYVSVLSYIILYIEKGNIAPSTQEVWGYYKYYFFRILGSSFVAGIFMVICFICCIIPGIYVFPAMSLFYPIIIMENETLGHSFDRSFKLVKNEWWITAAILLVVWIITYFMSMVIQIPAAIIMMFSAITHTEQPISNAYIILSATGQYLSYIFFIIPIIASALIYFNLVERKESTGLMSRIESLGADAAERHHSEEEY